MLKNAHLLRFPHPSSLRSTTKYVSLLRVSGALHLGIFEQPVQIQQLILRRHPEPQQELARKERDMKNLIKETENENPDRRRQNQREKPFFLRSELEMQQRTKGPAHGKTEQPDACKVA